jgi:hypothetical protein
MQPFPDFFVEIIPFEITSRIWLKFRVSQLIAFPDVPLSPEHRTASV